MGKKRDGKPRGRMTAYAFFVQTCREEHKKKHPGEQVVFSEFSKKCSEKWKGMQAKDKARFEEMAAKDKIRYEREMQSYEPPAGDKGKGRKRRKKDPNAPKRALSAFMFFCNDERPKVKDMLPGAGVGDIAKELGKRWEVQKDRSRWDGLAAKDRVRYEKEMAVYKGKKPKTGAPVAAAPVPVEEDDEDDDDDEEDDDDDDDEEEDE